MNTDDIDLIQTGKPLRVHKVRTERGLIYVMETKAGICTEYIPDPEPAKETSQPAASYIDPTGKTHLLKCWTDEYRAIAAGVKTHEVRLNDRDYKVGDVLELREFHPGGEVYSGSACRVVVTHVTFGGTWGVRSNMVVMSIRMLEVVSP